MKVLGEVVTVQFLRGGVSVVIKPIVDEAAEDPYYKDRPRGTVEFSGLTEEAGKQFQPGQEVTIDISSLSQVTVESKGAEIDLTNGDGDIGEQDDASGD